MSEPTHVYAISLEPGPSDERGRWQYGCGQCGGQAFISPTLECVVYDTAEPCEQCTQFTQGVDEQGDLVDRVCGLLGFCGCGAPDAVEAQFRKHLTEIGQPFDDRRDAYKEWDYLTLYLLDALGWTEHGGSVIGSWLTPEGEEALHNLSTTEGP